jgi:hypothetical protein
VQYTAAKVQADAVDRDHCLERARLARCWWSPPGFEGAIHIDGHKHHRGRLATSTYNRLYGAARSTSGS